jgi:hypothetical protein
MFQEAAPVGDGGRRAFLYVLFEKLLGALVYPWGPATSLVWFEGVSSVSDPRVALDRGEAHTEEASGPSFGYPAFYSLDYLAAEVFRVGSHSPMITPGSIVLTDAVAKHVSPVFAYIVEIERGQADFRERAN